MKTYTESTESLHTDDHMWKQAITDAKGEISRAQGRIKRLRRSIRLFEEKLSTGEPWPDAVQADQRTFG